MFLCMKLDLNFLFPFIIRHSVGKILLLFVTRLYCVPFTTYYLPLQERILLDRDRVVSKTWYHEKKKRWEIDPVAVPYAVSKKLVEHVRIRHDWGAMYIALKGEDEEFYVDIKVVVIYYFLVRNIFLALFLV